MEEDNGYKLLNPKSKFVMYIKNCLIILIMAAAVVLMFIYREQMEMSDTAAFIIAAAAGSLAMFLLIIPVIFYRHYRYIVDTEKVDVRRGVFFIRRTVVPIERIHQVQVRTGPISSRFGLADVVITTAGGEASIQYLETQVADSVADYLNDAVNKIIRDRETE